MIMRENEKRAPRGRRIARVTERALAAGMILVGLSLFGVIVQVTESPTLTIAAAARFGKMLENVAAAAALLTAGAYLIERVARQLHSEEK